MKSKTKKLKTHHLFNNQYNLGNYANHTLMFILNLYFLAIRTINPLHDDYKNVFKSCAVQLKKNSCRSCVYFIFSDKILF